MTCYSGSFGTGWMREVERPSMWLGWVLVRNLQFCCSLQTCGIGLRKCLVSSSVDGGDWGLNESDMEASVATVRSLCEQLDADLIPLRDRSEAAGLVRDYLIRRRVGELDFLEVR